MAATTAYGASRTFEGRVGRVGDLRERLIAGLPESLSPEQLPDLEWQADSALAFGKVLGIGAPLGRPCGPPVPGPAGQAQAACANGVWRYRLETGETLMLVEAYARWKSDEALGLIRAP